MLKKRYVLSLVLFVGFTFFMNGTITQAQVTNLSYNSSNDTYYIYFDPTNVSKFTFKNLNTGAFAEYNYSGENHMTFRCNTPFEMKFYNSSGTLLSTYEGQTTQVQNDACGSGDSGGENGCIGCDIFNCPGWDQYMGKVNQIINAIPPAPNWNNVAGIMRDTIVPRFISDLGNMLGSAPSAPTSRPQISEPARPTIPEQPPQIDISTNEPDMQDVPGLKESGFDKEKIESEAPTIEFREDPTGGFEITDPVNSLPEMPTDDFPIPGQTDAGEWEQYKPPEVENPYPMPESGESELPTGPIPPSNSGDAPMPGGDTGSAPVPGGDEYNPPVPGSSGEEWGTGNYKKHPDDPDGSG